MPAFAQSLLAHERPYLDLVTLFEPDAWRRHTMCALAVAKARQDGQGDRLEVTADVAAAFSGADYVFSALRVGGDEGRVVDEQVALERGLVGQETVGAGGAAMALRTIPVILAYCSVLQAVAPEAVLINFTNPAGLITQAVSCHTSARVVGVCDTPSSTIEALRSCLVPAGRGGAEPSFGYAGLNHLGWVTSAHLEGEDLLARALDDFDKLRAHDQMFSSFDPLLVRRLGAVPTEYLYYYYDAARYVANMARAGQTRGQQVRELNEELLRFVAVALEKGDVGAAWAEYVTVMGQRQSTYMSADTGQSSHPEVHALALGGYERLALAVVEQLSLPPDDNRDQDGKKSLILNMRNQGALSFLDPDDIVELAVSRQGGWFVAEAPDPLPLSAQGLVAQVKQYERLLLEAAVSADATLAGVALSLHPLVPGLTMARDLIGAYKAHHGPDLAYLR